MEKENLTHQETFICLISIVATIDGAVGKVLAMDTTAHSFLQSSFKHIYIHAHTHTHTHALHYTTTYTTYTAYTHIGRQLQPHQISTDSKAWTCYRTRDWLSMSIILSMCSSPFPFCHFFFLLVPQACLCLSLSFSLSLSLTSSLSLSFCFLLTPSSVSFVLTILREEGREKLDFNIS